MLPTMASLFFLAAEHCQCARNPSSTTSTQNDRFTMTRGKTNKSVFSTEDALQGFLLVCRQKEGVSSNVQIGTNKLDGGRETSMISISFQTQIS